MNKAEKVMKGIAIILKYNKKAGVCAEHDEFFCGHDIGEMSDEDDEAMNHLGWDWDDDIRSWKIYT